jgi:hypothetical protein
MDTPTTNIIRSKFEQQAKLGELRVITQKDGSWASLVLPTIHTLNELKTHLQQHPTELVFFKNSEGVNKEVVLNAIRTTGTSTLCRILWAPPEIL